MPGPCVPHLPTAPAPGAAGLPAASFTWLGCMLPVLLHRLGWEEPSLALLALNGGHDLVSLPAAATVLWLLA